MIKKTEMFTITCDNCDRNAEDFSCWQDAETAEENALQKDWVRNGTRHYCKDCLDYYTNDLIAEI
jgi:hypothetical protein